MRAQGFEVTDDDVAGVHRGLKDGRLYTGVVDREIVGLLQRRSGQATGDGQVGNAGS